MPQQAPEPEFDALYRELILDHYRSPRHHEPLANADVVAEGYNPLCGDEVEIGISFEDGTIKDLSLHGRGCSISLASGSMMTDVVIGKSFDDVTRLSDLFTEMVKDVDAETPEELGDLEALQGVAKFPVRVKCATLAWHTLADGLKQRQAGGVVQHEE
ncbi:MAG: SUF system NifU family Fe-S cluster assembly protein [Chloroflexi bacterium]|nr:SUF system NifU family Fe-S cluster assembly protein [Chloroflexota bacterium]MCI0849333.1 SUF system NifU family Fe-S cluster assembly protein [Chloroflexota bacterium]